MPIAYDKTNAPTAFSKLADLLANAAATIGGERPISDGELNDVLSQIVETHPEANPIRQAFDEARDFARRADDQEMDAKLTIRHADLIADHKAASDFEATDQERVDACQRYVTHLIADAAWIRRVGEVIAEGGTIWTDTPAVKKLDEILAASERGASAAERTEKEIAAARGDIRDIEEKIKDACSLIRKLRPEWLTGETSAPRQYIELAGSLKLLIFDLWKQYEKTHDPADNGGQKADVQTFYELDGGKKLRTGLTLQECIEKLAEKDNKHRAPVEILKRIIKSERERRNAAEKAQPRRQKPKSSQKRRQK